jgi:endonuclease YncB( thermonuclease family)
MEDCLFDEEVVVTIRSRKSDTLIGDVEYRDPNTRRKTSVAQTLVRKGWSSYLRETIDRGLEILEEMAEDQRVGVWKILDPEHIKAVQDSAKQRQDRMLDTLEQEFKDMYPPIDTMIIL